MVTCRRSRTLARSSFPVGDAPLSLRIRPVVLSVLLAAAGGAQAQSDLFRCTDGAGHATFTDEAGRREMLRSKRADNCERLSGLPVASVPASRNTPRNASAEAPRTHETGENCR